MVSTRSASGLTPLPQQTATEKRKAAPEHLAAKSKQKKVRTAADEATTIPPNTAALVPNGTNTTPLVPAILSFDFEDAKQHLINVDARFEDVFAKMQCKPFEQLEQVHPFRWVVDVMSSISSKPDHIVFSALATSIL
jgi:DNA-3-methyladenine glycosylase II